MASIVKTYRSISNCALNMWIHAYISNMSLESLSSQSSHTQVQACTRPNTYLQKNKSVKVSERRCVGSLRLNLCAFGGYQYVDTPRQRKHAVGKQSMPTRYADFVRLSFQICSKIEKILKIVVCRLGMPTSSTFLVSALK